MTCQKLVAPSGMPAYRLELGVQLTWPPPPEAEISESFSTESLFNPYRFPTQLSPDVGNSTKAKTKITGKKGKQQQVEQENRKILKRRKFVGSCI